MLFTHLLMVARRQLRLLAGHGLIIRAAGNAPRTGSETAIISTSRCPATAILAIAAQGAALGIVTLTPIVHDQRL